MVHISTINKTLCLMSGRSSRFELGNAIYYDLAENILVKHNKVQYPFCYRVSPHLLSSHFYSLYPPVYFRGRWGCVLRMTETVS